MLLYVQLKRFVRLKRQVACKMNESSGALVKAAWDLKDFEGSLTYFAEDVRLGLVTYRLLRRLGRVTPAWSLVLVSGHCFAIGSHNGVGRVKHVVHLVYLCLDAVLIMLHLDGLIHCMTGCGHRIQLQHGRLWGK